MFTTSFDFPLFTDHPGELTFNFTIHHDLEHLGQHLTCIPGHFGDSPHILDLFLTYNPVFAVSLSPAFGS